MITQFLKVRRLRKYARELVHHAGHLRNMREDLMRDEERRRLALAEGEVAETLKTRDWDTLQKKCDALVERIHELTPARSFPGLRENLEIAVVAIAVAMAFRSYFLQPFKIPTGSMQPTLYGIQLQPGVQPTFMDRLPLKAVKWFVTGQWYTEVKATVSGDVITDPMLGRRTDSTDVTFYVGSTLQKVPSLAGLVVRPGDVVTRGQVLWSGMRTAGDHLLVNKVAWNFKHPRRGDIIVFNTDRLPTLPPNTHYIKRLAALPGETLSINPPDLIINGQPVLEPPPIARIVHREPGYAGYQLVDSRALGSPYCVLRTPNDQVTLAEGEYFALGDNTGNSRDSRYWGPVKQANLVGPAFLVYWPLKRWGLAR